ncbi:MAG: hypothetical protein WKG07_33180 [Hymenobacter sp.]
MVIGGSHGKTSITALILHVLRFHGRKFDYAVGAQLAGFDLMVQLTDDAPVIIIEGDEYLSSPVDRRPKFHLYQHHIGVISGISWDHINVFPTEEIYREQFRDFCRHDAQGRRAHLRPRRRADPARGRAQQPRRDLHRLRPARARYPRRAHVFADQEGRGGTDSGVWRAQPAQHFGGQGSVQAAGHQGQGLLQGRGLRSKARRGGWSWCARALRRWCTRTLPTRPASCSATAAALKQQFPQRRLVACLELHTFSSLNPDFLPQYAHCFDAPDVAVVYFNPQVLEHKRLPPLAPAAVAAAFAAARFARFYR